jgi:hypothetical protein
MRHFLLEHQVGLSRLLSLLRNRSKPHFSDWRARLATIFLVHTRLRVVRRERSDAWPLRARGRTPRLRHHCCGALGLCASAESRPVRLPLLLLLVQSIGQLKHVDR